MIQNVSFLYMYTTCKDFSDDFALGKKDSKIKTIRILNVKTFFVIFWRCLLFTRNFSILRYTFVVAHTLKKSFVSRLVAFVQSESLRLIVCTSFLNYIKIILIMNYFIYFTSILLLLWYIVETNKEYKIHVCNSSLPVGYKMSLLTL